jgi:putative DNA primase/helicase
MNAPIQEQVPQHAELLFTAAVEYESLGWSVIPVGNDKKPLIPWKTYQEKRADFDQIAVWWDKNPTANVGIVTGLISSLIVLDLDSQAAIEQAKKLGIPKTPVAQTGKGLHVYLKHPGGTVHNFAGKLPGMDLRADGGYVVAPPSTHPSGAVYKWLVSPAGQELADAPRWLLDLITDKPVQTPEKPQMLVTKSNYAKAGLRREIENVMAATEGQRNNTLNIAALKLGQLIAAGQLERGEVENALRAAGLDAGLTAGEVDKTIASGIAKGLSEPRQIPDGEPSKDGKSSGSTPLSLVKGEKVNPLEVQTRTSDLGNTRRLVKLYGPNIRYLAERGVWLKWNGIRWEPDKLGYVHQLAIKTVMSIYREVADEQSPSVRRALAKWALASESRSRLENMVKLAQHQLGIATEIASLDGNQWLLNCQNGTLDLRTGALREHRRDDLLTKCTSTRYAADAQAPTWLRYLARIMGGNQDLIAFLQRAIGYSLTAETSEQCMFFLHGNGKNGKSTFIETISALMGDYALKMPTESFMSKVKGAGIPNDIARLPGARFVVAAETEEGRRLDEALVKDLTGGDTISARFLHQEFFDFRPTHKLWMYGNHKPDIRGTDEGIWRRINLIPFSVQIPAPERDPQLLVKLLGELPGILTWAVQGCLSWQRDGLKPPREVVSATESYRAEMDVISTWLDECCISLATASTSARKLYENYTRWCSDNGETPVKQRRLGLALTERGFARHRWGSGFQYSGIGLLNQEVNDDSRSK